MEEFRHSNSTEIAEQHSNSKVLNLYNAVKDFEGFFFTSNKGRIYKFIIEAVEKPLIETVLERVYGNQSMAAKILGINRNTLYSKIKRLGIEAKRWKSI